MRYSLAIKKIGGPHKIIRFSSFQYLSSASTQTKGTFVIYCQYCVCPNWRDPRNKERKTFMSRDSTKELAKALNEGEMQYISRFNLQKKMRFPTVFSLLIIISVVTYKAFKSEVASTSFIMGQLVDKHRRAGSSLSKASASGNRATPPSETRMKFNTVKKMRSEAVSGVLNGTNHYMSWRSQMSGWLDERNEELTPPNTPGAFVHVGKTAGSTISSLLTNGCHSWSRKPCRQVLNESYISKLTTYYHTPDYRKLNDRDYHFYVFTLRDPLSRFLSAFTYMHPANGKPKAGAPHYKRQLKFFYPCFPTVESFASAIGDGLDVLDYVEPIWNATIFPKKSDFCANLARASMASQVPEAEHIYLNTNKFVRYCKSYDKASILVLRTEFLWQDWVSANELLGQPKPIAIFSERVLRNVTKDTGQNPIVNKEVSTIGRKRLCHALRQEYATYFEVLRRAVNLNNTERRQSFAVYEKNCPWLNFSLRDILPPVDYFHFADHEQQ